METHWMEMLKICSLLAATESSSFNMSPIILGCLLTLLILCCVLVSKMYSRKRSTSDEALSGSKQSNALLCKQDMSKVLETPGNQWPRGADALKRLRNNNPINHT